MMAEKHHDRNEMLVEVTRNRFPCSHTLRTKETL
jgi:hypothetical protein